MSRGVFLIQPDGQLIEMREQAYDSEDLLQRLLARYPSLLAGDQIDPARPRRWLLINREVNLSSEDGGTGRWYVDHLFFDQDAVPTLVEVKRSTDTRIRREVVGQMLDYAANAVLYWPIEALHAQFEAFCQINGLDADRELASFLGTETEASDFWQQAKTNLQAGKIRLVFVADQIPTELRRIVEFLNRQMDPAEVLAVEIKQFAGEGLRTLVPNLVGQTVEAQQRKSGTAEARRQWDEETFFQELQNRRSAIEESVARQILDWARLRTSRIWWGRGQRSGSFVPTLHHNSVDHQLFVVYTYGTIEIYFQWYQIKAPFDAEPKRLELLNRLNAIAGVSIPAEAITRRPNVSLSLLADPERTAAFLEVFDWFIQEVKKT